MPRLRFFSSSCKLRLLNADLCVFEFFLVARRTCFVAFAVVATLQEILAANPDAKVVLTLRDVDSWWKSMASTISRQNKAYDSWGKLTRFISSYISAWFLSSGFDLLCFQPCVRWNSGCLHQPA